MRSYIFLLAVVHVMAGSSIVSAAIVTETAALFASDGANGDQFGSAVAIDGSYAVVGAPGGGSAYIYEYNGSSWLEAYQLFPTGASAANHTGNSVDIFGNTAVIGSYGAAGTVGSASVFQRDGGGSWNEIAVLAPSDGAAIDARYGWDVAIDGDTIVVGAGWSSKTYTKGGDAYIYNRDLGGTDNWGELQKIPSQAAAYARFGYSVDVDDTEGTIVVGTQNWNGGTWIFYRDGSGNYPLGPEDFTMIAPNWGDQPVAVSIDGNRIALGNYNRSTNVGQAGIWDRGEDWVQVASLVSPDYGAADRFGFDIAVEGDGETGKVIIGAPWADTGGLADSGAGYVFERVTGGYWTNTDTLTTTGRSAGDATGTSVGISEDVVILGGPYFDSGTTDVGAAHIYGTPTTTVPWPGDFDEDGDVDVSDLGILATNYGTTSGATWGMGDATGDGAVDVSDLGILATEYGHGTSFSTASSAVPEPGAIVLLVALGMSLAVIRRR